MYSSIPKTQTICIWKLSYSKSHKILKNNRDIFRFVMGKFAGQNFHEEQESAANVVQKAFSTALLYWF